MVAVNSRGRADQRLEAEAHSALGNRAVFGAGFALAVLVAIARIGAPGLDSAARQLGSVADQVGDGRQRVDAGLAGGDGDVAVGRGEYALVEPVDQIGPVFQELGEVVAVVERLEVGIERALLREGTSCARSCAAGR